MRPILFVLLLLVAIGGLCIVADPAQSAAAPAVAADVFSRPAPLPALTSTSPELAEVAMVSPAPPKAPTTSWKPAAKCVTGNCPYAPDQAKPDQAKPDQAKPDQAKPDQVATPLPAVCSAVDTIYTDTAVATVTVRRGGPLMRALSAWADRVRARRGH